MAKTLNNLLNDFLASEAVRCRILKDHQKGLTDFPMSSVHVTKLGTMDSSTIIPYILAELTGLDPTRMEKLLRDLKAKHDEVFPHAMTNQQLIDAAAAYSSGGVHIFGVSPATVHANVATQIVVRGNGYECDKAKVQVQFVTDAHADLPAQVLSVRADEDLNERVTVTVLFPVPGDWRTQIKNAADTVWSGDGEGKNIVRVLA
jgi:hypothetical protein